VNYPFNVLVTADELDQLYLLKNRASLVIKACVFYLARGCFTLINNNM